MASTAGTPEQQAAHNADATARHSRPVESLKAIKNGPDDWMIRLRDYDEQGRRRHMFIGSVYSKDIGEEAAEMYAREFALAPTLMEEIDRLREVLERISRESNDKGTRLYAEQTLRHDWADTSEEKHKPLSELASESPRKPLTLARVREICGDPCGSVTVGPDSKDVFEQFYENLPPDQKRIADGKTA